MRVAVIGVGGVGSAACRFLAKAGVSVTGFERFEIGHERGSSHGASRIIRKTYPDPYFTQLIQEAYPLWEELETEARESLFVKTGILYLGPSEHPEMVGVRNSLVQNKVDFEILNAQEIQARYPVFRRNKEKHEEAIFQAEGGFLRASNVVAANVRLAREYGAEIRENVKVTGIRQVKDIKDKVEVALETHTDSFDRVIVTTGAWMETLFPNTILPSLSLSVTRQTLAYFASTQEAQKDFEQIPVWIDAASHWYGFPTEGTIPGIKVAHHVGLLATDADNIAPLTETDIEVIRQAAHARFLGLTDTCTYAKTCLYTNTPDENFLYLLPRDMPGVLGISACSGHGFKFTVLNGKLAADWACGRDITDTLARVNRFTKTI